MLGREFDKEQEKYLLNADDAFGKMDITAKGMFACYVTHSLTKDMCQDDLNAYFEKLKKLTLSMREEV